eukprot:219757-Prymnesium_polylepis.1
MVARDAVRVHVVEGAHILRRVADRREAAAAAANETRRARRDRRRRRLGGTASGSVVRRASDAQARGRARARRQAEIAQLDVLGKVDEDVLRLEVAVDDALSMDVLQPTEQLAQHAPDGLVRQLSFRQQIVERPLAILHLNVQHAPARVLSRRLAWLVRRGAHRRRRPAMQPGVAGALVVIR